MKIRLQLVPVALAAAIALLGAPAHAAITTYTSQSSFLGAVSNPGVDTFDDLALGANITGNRSAGSYTYKPSTVPNASADGFYMAGTAGDVWLSTNVSEDTILFNGFASNVKAIGANFFGSNADGLFAANQSLTITMTDSLGGSSTQTFVGVSTGSFLGFTTTGSVVSMTVSITDAANATAWPTVNNLTLATVAAVPEPESWALMGIGLGVVGLVLRRRTLAG